jgi:signal transduction histidine kinase
MSPSVIGTGAIGSRGRWSLSAGARYNPWAALLLALVASCAPLGAMATETKRVLLLHSFGREFSPYDAALAALRTELAERSSEPLAFYDVSLHAGLASGLDDEQPFAEYLRHRFDDSPPDVVVTIGPPAAAFYVKYRDQLFPGTPLAITALDQRLVPKSTLRAGDTVVADDFELPRMVDNILRVLPDTKTIAVVIGDSPLERFWLVEMHREFAQFDNRISFEWLNRLSLPQLRKRIAVLPPHFAVLYTLLLTDSAGVPQEGGAALASLVALSSAPIFSVHGNELGHGVVGGPYISQLREGALTAAAVLRVLSGKTAAEPTIQLIGFDVPVYDWRELKRWGIDRTRLPAGSEIRFRPPSLWDEHRTLITTAISIFLLQATLSIGLMWQRIRRRRAESEALTLGGRLITAHEDERRRLARELHDDFTQRVAGLAIDAAKLPGGDLSPSHMDADRSVYARLVQLSDDIHSLSYRLHPSMLDDLGLVEALKAECDRVARSDSVRVDVEADKLPQRLPKEAALCIYRIAQEALRNISRHAKASIVQLSLALNDGGLLLAVSDNGSGFEPGTPTGRPSLGHASMRERIRLLKGKLDIQSIPGRGTTIRAWVPIPEVSI